MVWDRGLNTNFELRASLHSVFLLDFCRRYTMQCPSPVFLKENQ